MSTQMDVLMKQAACCEVVPALLTCLSFDLSLAYRGVTLLTCNIAYIEKDIGYAAVG